MLAVRTRDVGFDLLTTRSRPVVRRSNCRFLLLFFRASVVYRAFGDKMANPTDEDAMEVGMDYADCVVHLPAELQRHVTAMLECDAQQRMMVAKMRELTTNSSAGNLNTDLLTKLLQAGRTLGDRKAEATQFMADLVEEKVRRLARSSAKYSGSGKAASDGGPKAGGSSSSSKEKTGSGDRSQERHLPSTSGGTGPAAAKAPRKYSTDTDDNESNNNDAWMKKRPKRAKADEPDYRESDDEEEQQSAPVHRVQTPLPRSTATAVVLSQGTSSKKRDVQKTETKPKKKFKKPPKNNPSSSNNNKYVPLDENEPTYCVCDEISYGEMICCDNDLCPIEWFHFSCVSLLSKPKGKWFCPRCRGDRPSVMKPKALIFEDLVRYNKEKEENA